MFKNTIDLIKTSISTVDMRLVLLVVTVGLFVVGAGAPGFGGGLGGG
jgi:hypothetical protein